jgi:hypothetical protein
MYSTWTLKIKLPTCCMGGITKSQIQTQEATNNALVVRFIKILGTRFNLYN